MKISKIAAVALIAITSHANAFDLTIPKNVEYNPVNSGYVNINYGDKLNYNQINFISAYCAEKGGIRLIYDTKYGIKSVDVETAGTVCVGNSERQMMAIKKDNNRYNVYVANGLEFEEVSFKTMIETVLKEIKTNDLKKTM